MLPAVRRRVLAAIVIACGAASPKLSRGASPEPSRGAAPAAQDATAVEAFAERLRTTDDVAWLESIAASEAALRREWRATVHRISWNKRHRTDAYVRLGMIGTPDSLAAIRRVEEALKGGSLLSDPLEADTIWTTPTPGAGDTVLRPQTSAIVGQRSFGVLTLETYGAFAPYLLWQEPGRKWSRPILAGAPAPHSWSFEPALTRSGTGLAIAFHIPQNVASSAAPPRSIPVDVDEVLRDSDGDGWTDREERHLGLDPASGDTDRDGLSDTIDVTPRYAPQPGEAADEDAQMLRRAVFTMYGLTGSRWAIFVKTGTRPIQLTGHSGPVLYGVDLPTRDTPRTGTPPPIRGGAQAAWRISARTATDATVEFTDWAGIAFRSTSRVTLKKIGAEWVVVACRTDGLR
jgi:hypothetical protein